MKKIRPKNKVAILDKKSYFDSYYENRLNLSWQKYTYINKIKKKIFSLHHFMNADECSVRFNG